MQDQGQKIHIKQTFQLSKFQTTLTSLLKSRRLLDVTIACEGQYIQVHKVVLAIFSPYFQDLLTHYKDNSIIFLKDVTYSQLQCIVNFMYTGETSCSLDELASLISVAKSLKIEELADIKVNFGHTFRSVVPATPVPLPFDPIVALESSRQCLPISATSSPCHSSPTNLQESLATIQLNKVQPVVHDDKISKQTKPTRQDDSKDYFTAVKIVKNFGNTLETRHQSIGPLETSPRKNDEKSGVRNRDLDLQSQVPIEFSQATIDMNEDVVVVLKTENAKSIVEDKSKRSGEVVKIFKEKIPSNSENATKPLYRPGPKSKTVKAAVNNPVTSTLLSETIQGSEIGGGIRKNPAQVDLIQSQTSQANSELQSNIHVVGSNKIPATTTPEWRISHVTKLSNYDQGTHLHKEPSNTDRLPSFRKSMLFPGESCQDFMNSMGSESITLAPTKRQSQNHQHRYRRKNVKRKSNVAEEESKFKGLLDQDEEISRLFQKTNFVKQYPPKHKRTKLLRTDNISVAQSPGAIPTTFHSISEAKATNNNNTSFEHSQELQMKLALVQREQNKSGFTIAGDHQVKIELDELIAQQMSAASDRLGLLRVNIQTPTDSGSETDVSPEPSVQDHNKVNHKKKNLTQNKQVGSKNLTIAENQEPTGTIQSGNKYQNSSTNKVSTVKPGLSNQTIRAESYKNWVSSCSEIIILPAVLKYEPEDVEATEFENNGHIDDFGNQVYSDSNIPNVDILLENTPRKLSSVKRVEIPTYANTRTLSLNREKEDPSYQATHQEICEEDILKEMDLDRNTVTSSESTHESTKTNFS